MRTTSRAGSRTSDRNISLRVDVECVGADPDFRGDLDRLIRTLAAIKPPNAAAQDPQASPPSQERRTPTPASSAAAPRKTAAVPAAGVPEPERATPELRGLPLLVKLTLVLIALLCAFLVLLAVTQKPDVQPDRTNVSGLAAPAG